MNQQAKPRLAELKVGIFVLVTCLILGGAIFTIGTQVGLLEDTFYARTYLNNVSGLKPGDIVLLAGVEVGNVIEVTISASGELPSTSTNTSLLEEIEVLTQRRTELEVGVTQTRERLESAREDYRETVERYGAGTPEAERSRTQRRELELVVQRQQDALEDLSDDISKAQGSLQNIVVLTEIASIYRDWIRSDSSISLGSIGLLGDKYIEISLGRSTELPPVITEQVDSWYGTSSQEVVIITGFSEAGFQELITGADDVLSNLSNLSEKLNDILGPLSTGEGTVGSFIRDNSFYNNLNQAVRNANLTVMETTALVEDFRKGQGTLGRLLQESEVYDNIDEATARLRDVLAKLNEGEGSLGRFLKDPTIYENSNRTIENIRQVTQRMEEGQGTLGKLSTDDELYQKLDRSLDGLGKVVTDIQEGKGTLGRLAKDDQLYRNLNQFSSEVVKLLYDFRQDPKKFLTIKFEIF